MKRVVISGASGMIGATLIRQLVSAGAEVLAIVRPNSEKNTNLPEGELVQRVECDLSAFRKFPFDQVQGSYDTFYHFAWVGTFGASRNDVYLQHANIGYTLDAIWLAHELGCKTFIGVGSQAEYGPKDDVKLAPDTPTEPVTGYGITKLDAGRLGRLYAGQLDMRFIWARILSVYGPMDNPYTLVMSTIGKLLAGNEVHFTKGEQLWDFLYSEDAATAFRLIDEKGRNGAVYCLGSGKTVSLASAISKLCRMVRPDCHIGLGDLPYNENQVMYLCADIDTLQKDTGFSPATALEEGFAKTIAWYKEIKK